MALSEDAEVTLRWWSRAMEVRGWHTRRRSRVFVALPGVITLLLAINLIWDVIRNNVNDQYRSEWPLRLVLLDVAPTATLLGVFGALMLARAQVAQTMSPHFGYAWIEDSDDSGGKAESRWQLYFYNGGPGHAKTRSVTYKVRFYGDRDAEESDWIEVGELIQALKKHGVDRDDLDIFWLGRAPLIPQSKANEGFRLLSANYKGLAALENIEVRIAADDVVGDHHVLHIRAIARLPLHAVEGVAAWRPRPQPPRLVKREK